MGLYIGKRVCVDQLLHWEFVAIVYKISNIMANGKNNSCCMFTRDSQHFPTPTCASTLYNVHIQEGFPDINPKNVIHKRSDWMYLTLGNILQHLIFNFWPYRPFQLLDSFLCFTSIEPNLAMCSIKKLQIEWCFSFLNQTFNDSTSLVVILSHLCFESFDMAQWSGAFSSTHVAKTSLYFCSSYMKTL